MTNGCMGKILMVDLGNGQIVEETLSPSFHQHLLSGMGLAARLLYDRIPAGADPLGPDNILGFVAGLLTGSGALFAGRWMAVGKSPLTGGWGDANCGGTFAPAIKRCGYDGIFFKGISPRPVYLQIAKGKAVLCDAGEVWGKDTVETERWLVQNTPGRKKPKVVCIGPAGEKCSLIAGIANDGGRMAARSGLGAVMGAKRLKAVALAGNQKIRVHDRGRIHQLSQACNKRVQLQPPFLSGPMMARLGMAMRALPVQLAQDGMLFKFMLKKWGTISMNQLSIEMGDAPVQNWRGSHLDFGRSRSNAIDPDAIRQHEISKYHCYSCPLGCGGICRIKGKYGHGHKPEYETVLALGALCMNEDLDSIFYLNEQLNRAGMDTISAGATVAFALECFENGLITRDDADGLDLRWGHTDAIVALIHKMIARDGIGDLLADGVARAAEHIGKGAAAFAMHAGGQELSMHDGRNDPGYALHYCIEPTPGRHTIGSQLYYEMYRLWKKAPGLPKPALVYGKSGKYKPTDKQARMAVACSQFVNLLNAAGMCLFGAFMGVDRFPIFEWLDAATGQQQSPSQYLSIGQHIQDLRQAFNLRHGVQPGRFQAADRSLGRPALTAGANAGRTIAIEEMKQDYWRICGWDAQTGGPLPDKTADLIERTVPVAPADEAGEQGST